MALTPSNMVVLGFKAPDFILYDTVSDKKLALNNLKGKKGTLITFICNHCPYVKHINKALVKIANKYMSSDISFIAINSNDVINYPEDSPVLMKETAQILGYPFPYLYDEDQSVARAYQAACTPDFYLFDSNFKCIYRGQFDDSRPGQGTATGRDIASALDKVLQGKIPNSQQKPSIGCNIKWK